MADKGKWTTKFDLDTPRNVNIYCSNQPSVINVFADGQKKTFIDRLTLELYKDLLFELYIDAMESRFRAIIIDGVMVEKAEFISEEINLLNTIIE